MSTRVVRPTIRNPVRLIAWLLLDYPLEPVTWSEWAQWPAPATGIGAVRTCFHGVSFAVLLDALLIWHYLSGTDDRYWVGFFALAYCPLPGFLASLRTRTISTGGTAGALTAVIGTVLALAALIVLARDPSLLRFGGDLIVAAGIGWVFGAVGGAAALLCLSLVAAGVGPQRRPRSQ